MLSTNDISSSQLALAARGFRLLALNGDSQARAAAVALEAQLRDRFQRTDFNEAAVAANTAPARSQPAPEAGSAYEIDESSGSNRHLNELLRNMRQLLDMDIAFVSEFVGDKKVFRHIDTVPESAELLAVGQSGSLAQSYCKRVVDGRFSNAIPDTSKSPEAMALPATAAMKIASYISVPVVLRDGEVFGTLCCISHKPRSALGNLQIDALRKVAEMVSIELEKQRS